MSTGLTTCVPEPPEGWQVDTPCAGKPDLFFATEDEPNYSDLGWAPVCAACPVRTDCLAHALRIGEPFGVWGGFTPTARWNLAKLLRRGTVTWQRVVDSLS